MHPGPLQVLQAARRATPPAAAPGRLLLAGAGGVLGNEIVRRMVGLGRFDTTEVLAREPIRPGLRGVTVRLVECDDPAAWPPTSAQAPGRPPPAGRPDAVARWMLGVFKYMRAGSEQPVRTAKVAHFVAAALQLAPPGIHVAAPQSVWLAAQGDPRAVVGDWLHS